MRALERAFSAERVLRCLCVFLLQNCTHRTDASSISTLAVLAMLASAGTSLSLRTGCLHGGLSSISSFSQLQNHPDIMVEALANALAPNTYTHGPVKLVRQTKRSSYICAASSPPISARCKRVTAYTQMRTSGGVEAGVELSLTSTFAKSKFPSETLSHKLLPFTLKFHRLRWL